MVSDITPIQEKRTRRPRAMRVKDNLPGFRPGPRDPELVQYVYDFRFLTTDQLVALSGGDYTSVRKRLAKLYQHGYLDRRWDPPDNPRQGKAVYQLDRKGAELLAQVKGIDPGDLDWSVDRNKVEHVFVQHALMVSRIRTVFTLAMRARPSVKLLFWRNDNETRDSVKLDDDDPVYKGARRETLPIVPDSFFGLEWPGARGYFMLEADRSTMPRQDFLNKLRAYWLWHKAQGHTKKLQINRFVVLTVTLSKERARHLFEDSKKADDRGSGSAMFWFTTLEQLTLEQPERALQNIWVTWEKGQPARAALVPLQSS